MVRIMEPFWDLHSPPWPLYHKYHLFLQAPLFFLIIRLQNLHDQECYNFVLYLVKHLIQLAYNSQLEFLGITQIQVIFILFMYSF